MKSKTFKSANGHRLAAGSQERAMLLAVSQAIATVRDKQDLLRLVLEHIKPVFGFYDCGLFVLDADGQHHSDWTVLLPEIDPSDANVALQAAGLGRHTHPGSIIDAHMRQAAHGPLIINYEAERRLHPDYPFFSVVLAMGHCEAMAGLLQVGGLPVGMFYVNSQQFDFFRPEQLPLFQAIADQIAVAVANILANEEILAREREKTQLLEITELIAQVKATDDLLRLIVHKVKPLFGFHDCGLFVVSTDGQTHTDLAAVLPDVSPSEWNTAIAAVSTNVPHPGSVVEWMMATMAQAHGPVLFDFADLVARFPDYPQLNGTGLLEIGYRDCLAAPLTVRGQPRGFFCINALRKNFFRPASFSLFQSIAHTISIAVANILAHEEIVAREREKALLLSLSEEMATIRDQQDLWRVMMAKVKPLIPFADAVVGVYTEEYRYCDHILTVSPPERVSNPNYAQVVHHKATVAGSPYEYFLTKPKHYLFPLEELVEHYGDIPPLRLMRETGLGYTWHIKLNWAGQIIGFLHFHFGEASQTAGIQPSLVNSIADQVAVAVANILATEDIRAREQEKTVLLAISNAIATINHKGELVRFLFEQVRPLFGFDDAGLAVLEPDGQHYNDWAAQYAAMMPPDIAAKQHPEHRQAWPSSLLEQSARELTEAGHPLVYTLTPELAEQWPDLPDLRAELTDGQQEILFTTLRAGGQLLGTFNINSKRKGHFATINHSIFQAVADQVAVAVANILANEELRAREKEKTIQLAVNNALVSSKDRESLCVALAGQMNQLVPFSLFVLCLWIPGDESRYQITLRRQPDGQFASMQREVMRQPPPPLTLAERTRLFEQPGVFVGGIFEALCAQYPLYRFVSQQFGVRSHLRLSLDGGADVQASIVVSGTGPDDFTAADYDTLRHLVPQISLALDNLLAFERLDQQRREKAAQVAATNVLTSELPFNELVRELAPAIDSLVPCDLLHLCLLPPHAAGPEADVAVVKEAGCFRALPRAEVLRHLPAEDLAASYEELRALTDETRLYVGDEAGTALGAARLLRYFFEAQAVRALLLVPLRVGGQVAAGLLLGHRFAYGFSAPDAAKIEALAAQMALALGHRFAFAEIAVLKQQLEHENSYLQDEIKTTHNFEEIIGTSPALLALLRQVSQVAATDTTVCIGGETGTGKELIARALHNLSPRKNRLLVKVNCAALPTQLIESELFGHEKGAFTGAHERRIGKFELADGGSIFLDEIGELPLELQAKLLRVLQEKEIERVGGKGPIRTDVRIIAATNRDLRQEVQAGRFRQDLYFRLMVFPLLLPPLRERREDLPALATHFLFQFAKKMGKPHKGIAPRAMRELMAYDWPGNIRELQHTLEQAVIVSSKPLLELARPLQMGAATPMLAERNEAFRLRSLHDLEREHIVATLRHTNGRIRGDAGAAELLNIKATTLEARMKKLGIEKNYVVRKGLIQQ